MTDRYTIISADCHAGANHETYRGFLESKYHDDFDAWREKYRNPFRDLQDGGRVRNWDNERRLGDLYADGQVAEVVFPNTVPPFFPSFILFARPPRADQLEHRLAGIRAHNRWLAAWCAEFPDQRAGIGQTFLNDVDEAVKDVEFIAANNLRGGVLISAIPPDCKDLAPLYDPVYDPFWAACEDLGVIVNSHGGTGAPNYGKYSVADLLFITEVSFYSHRPFYQLLLSGVFERFPKLKFVMTEQGCAWLVGALAQMDETLAKIRDTGTHGRDALRREPHPAQECHRVLPAKLLGGHQPARPRRRRRPRSAGVAQGDVGLRLSPQRGHRPLHPRAPAPSLLRHRPSRTPADPGRQRRRPVWLQSRCPRPTSRPTRPHPRRDRLTPRPAPRRAQRGPPQKRHRRLATGRNRRTRLSIITIRSPLRAAALCTAAIVLATVNISACTTSDNADVIAPSDPSDTEPTATPGTTTPTEVAPTSEPSGDPTVTPTEAPDTTGLVWAEVDLADALGANKHSTHGASDGFRMIIGGSNGEQLLYSPDGREWSQTPIDVEVTDSARDEIWTADQTDGKFKVERFEGVFGTDQVLTLPNGIGWMNNLAIGPAGVAALGVSEVGPAVDSRYDTNESLVGWSPDGIDWEWQTLQEAFGLPESTQNDNSFTEVQVAVGQDFVLAKIQTFEFPEDQFTPLPASFTPTVSLPEISASPHRWFIARVG